MNPYLVIPACYAASLVILANLGAMAWGAWWLQEFPELRGPR